MGRIVLVADDSPSIQKKAVGILKGEGFDIETVSNGVAAIKRLAVLHPVVVLADVSMPGRDGYEVCDFVKKSVELAHVPVLLVASDMEPYDEARGAHVKADGIIKKPFDPQELISLVVKFADECEAAAPTTAMPAAASATPTPEFAIFNDAPEEVAPAPAPAPDFSASSEGVALTEPVAEEPPAYPSEPQPAAAEEPYAAPQPETEAIVEPAVAAEFAEPAPVPEAQSAPADELPAAVEEPVEPSPAPEPLFAASYLEGMEAVSSEPVFIEDQSAPAAETAQVPEEVRTMIFRAPLQIADPVLKDETVPSPPSPEPEFESEPAAAAEPKVEAAAPVETSEVTAEEAPQPVHHNPAVTATSLDSFSLDDATAGQVHFASHAAETSSAEAAPVIMEEAAPAEALPPEPAAESVTPEAAQEPAPEAVPAEAPVEAAPPLPFDWNLVFTVVHKVVSKMSPPALPTEAVEEMARRLAEEIATEISAESSQPQA